MKSHTKPAHATLIVSLTIATSLAFTGTWAAPSLNGEAHNIIVLLADDIGTDLIGAYEDIYDNYPDPAYPTITPAIDYLASTGITFVNAWTSPICSPTRAQILSGRAARDTGIGNPLGSDQPGSGTLRSDIPTLATILRQAPTPYETALVGKWHVAEAFEPLTHPLGTESMPWFDRYAGSRFNLEDYNFWPKNFASEIDPTVDECAPAPCETNVSEYATVDTADDAIHLLGEMTEPFLLYVSFNAAHKPLMAPLHPLDGASCAIVQTDPICESTFDETDKPRDTRCMTQWLDNEVGRVLCAVDAQSLQSPTTIIFLSDNGTRGDASVPPFDPGHGKGTVYEGGLKVPFIVQSPRIPSELTGTTHDALILSQDIMATAADLAGAALPADPDEILDTVSIVPYLEGETLSYRGHIYAERFLPNFTPNDDGSPPAGYVAIKHNHAIRDVNGFKLIVQALSSGGETNVAYSFYDLANDPHEQVNLIGQVDLAPYDVPYANLKFMLDNEYPNFVLTGDVDGDGVVDLDDNCVDAANPDQRDSNADGYGNLCDGDLNGDCSTNLADVQVMQAVMFSDDPDADLDGDGVVNFVDVAVFRELFGRPPGPSGVAALCQ